MDLHQKLKAIYKQSNGERFFSFPLVLACIKEKNAISGDLRFYEGDNAGDICRQMTDLCLGEPLQYYLGHWEFMGSDFICRPGVLIPREDSGILVELASRYLPEDGRLADLCCGSGCLGISTLLSRPDCSCVSVDISPDAAELTGINAERLGVSSRLTVRRGDVLDPYFEPDDFDVLVCNPPYIRTGELDGLSENVKREPRLALDGGADGLRFYKAIKALANKHKDRIFICEMGWDQRSDMEKLFGDTAEPEFFNDGSGSCRCFVLKS